METVVTDFLLDQIERLANAVLAASAARKQDWEAIDNFSDRMDPKTALALVARIRELEAKVEVSMKTAWAKSMDLGRRAALEEVIAVSDAIITGTHPVWTEKEDDEEMTADGVIDRLREIFGAIKDKEPTRS